MVAAQSGLFPRPRSRQAPSSRPVATPRLDWRPRSGAETQMQDVVRVYVGTDRSQLLAVAVLEHSIRRHTRRPVQVCPLIDLNLPEPRDVRQGSRTNFSFAR